MWLIFGVSRACRVRLFCAIREREEKQSRTPVNAVLGCLYCVRCVCVCLCLCVCVCVGVLVCVCVCVCVHVRVFGCVCDRLTTISMK
jgi:hypothetical protein